MIIEFDICALIILIIMFFSAVYRKLFTGNANRIFIVVLIIAFASTVLEICAVLPEFGDSAMFVFSTIFYMLQSATLLTFTLYLIALTDGWHILKNKFYLVCLLSPFLLVCVLLFAVNPYTYCIFAVKGGIYYYGNLKWLIYLFAGAYFLMEIIHTFRYRKFLTRSKIITLFAIAPMVIFSLILQSVTQDLLIAMFTQTMAIFFYSITIQRAEEIFYEGTTARQRYCFGEDLRLAEFNHKKMTLCLFKIKDFSNGIETSNYEEASQLIRSIALKIQRVVQNNEMKADIYYLSGGCFCVTVREKFRDKAMALSEDILRTLTDTRAGKDFASVSQGFFCCGFDMPEDAEDYHSIQAVADNFDELVPGTDRVYRASQLGSDSAFTFITEIEGIIDRALKYKEFEVYYQPLYSVKEQRVNSAEALLRLNDEKYGWINPELIVSVAEKNGTIHQLGKLIYEDVCRFVSSEAFDKLGLDHVEVNLSVEQFKDRKLCDKLVRLINNYHVDPAKINFEITETAMTDAWDEVAQQINALKDCGFGLSLDDFGQKNSDLRRLSSLLLGIVKFDMEIVSEMTTEKGMVVLEAMAAMLRNLDIQIVAEGVETREMAEAMIQIGCDYLQGYYFSKPVPQHEFVEYVIKEGHRVI